MAKEIYPSKSFPPKYSEKKSAIRAENAYNRRLKKLSKPPKVKKEIDNQLQENPGMNYYLNPKKEKINTGRQIKNRRNPSEALAEAEDMARRFHGREPKAVYELVEEEKYTKDLAVIGQLMELNILATNGKAYIPLVFLKQKDIDTNELDQYIQVATDPKGENIYFYGGEQELDIDTLVSRGLGNEATGKGRELLVIGPVWSIVYWTDKHHLEGPRYQKKGSAYEHQFGERADIEGEAGEMPTLIYDTRNCKLMLSGGSYEVRDEGIYN